MRLVALALCLLASACAIPVHTARLDTLAEPSPREIAAAKALEDPACPPALGLLLPGLGQACLGRPAEGAVMAVATGAEVAAGVAMLANDPELRTSSLVPLVAAQDLWIVGLTDVGLTKRRAAQLPYTPVDTLPELVAAPFNTQVLRRPEVWAGTLGLLGGATTLILLTEPAQPGSPILFGREPPPVSGWTATLGLGTVLFEHVAIAEELAFRGLLQSDLARTMGPMGGWIAGSAVFGATHALNALLLPPEERLGYLGIAVPWITVAGAWLGWAYHRADYSLAPPVAIHFWYDLLITAISVAHDPSSGIFAMRFGGRL